MPEKEPIIEGMSGGPNANELKLVIKKEIDNISKFVRNNAQYADVFYSIDQLLEAARKRIEKTINHITGKADDTTGFDEFYKEYEPTLDPTILSKEDRVSALQIIWDTANKDVRDKFDKISDKNNTDNAILGKKTKNDAYYIKEVLQYYVMTLVGLLMSYNVLYTWITPKGENETGGGYADDVLASTGGLPELSGLSALSGLSGLSAAQMPRVVGGASAMPDITGGMPTGMPTGMPGVAGMPSSPFSVFRWIYDVPWTAIKGMMTFFKIPGKLFTKTFPPTLVYFFIIMCFISFGAAGLAKAASGGIADSLVSMSKGKFESSVVIYLFIVIFWLIDIVKTVMDNPPTYLNLIAGTILGITYLIIILVNALAFASIFKIIILFYIVYRLLFLIPISRGLQTFDAFAEVNAAATPILDPETKATIDSHRNKYMTWESFKKYVLTSTFLFENLFSFIFVIISLLSTSILGKKLKLPFLKSTLPIGMVVMILSFLKYKYSMLFDPACKEN